MNVTEQSRSKQGTESYLRTNIVSIKRITFKNWREIQEQMSRLHYKSHFCAEITDVCFFYSLILCRPFFATWTFNPLFSRLWFTKIFHHKTCISCFLHSLYPCLGWTSLIASLILIHIFLKVVSKRSGWFGYKVGLLLCFISLKYGLDIKIAVFPQFWPSLFPEVSAFRLAIVSHWHASNLIPPVYLL